MVMIPSKDAQRAQPVSQADLQRAHDLLEAVTAGTALLVAAIDHEFRYTFFNQAHREEVKRLTGRDIHLGTSLLAAFDDLPEQQAIAKAHWSRTLQGENRHYQLAFGEPGPYQRYYEVHQTPLRDADGQVVGAGEVAFDLTDQRLAEQALQQSQQQWARAFEGIQELMAVWEVVRDPAGAIVDWRLREANGTFLQATQAASLEAIRGKTAGQLFGAAAVAPNLPFIRQAMAAGTVQTVERDLNGRSYLITLCPLDEQYYLTTARDITVVKEAEAARRTSEARYRALFERMTEGFALHEIITDDQGQPCDYRFLELNPAFERLTGLKHADTVGNRVRDVLPDLEPYWIEQYGKVALTGEAVHLERFVPSLQRWYEAFAYQPAARQFAVIFTDITARKQAEEALHEADRRKDEFLAMLAHELRNPLAPIRNAVHVLRRTEDESPAVQERNRTLLTMMERQVTHLVRLVDDLLEVSRISRGQIDLQKEPIDLAVVISDAIDTSQPLITAGHHHLTRVLPPEPVWLEADPIRLTQVFANLLNNAAKYTEPGGQIHLTVTRQGGDAVVSIRDTGTGIPATLLPRIFDLFIQGNRSLDRAQGGLGIGLSLVRHLVEMHGGRVEAHSAGPGQGSEFIVRLPLATPRTDEATRPAIPSATPGTSWRVLVVDDNPDAADSLGLLLKLEGAEVLVVYDGPAALQALATFQPTVVLLDLRMPGMDGVEVARRLRQHPAGQHLTLVALTGWGEAEDRRRTRRAGFDHHLLKPTDPKALQALLASLKKGYTKS